MNESFVDLTYRGLSLGRRIKLTQVRPRSGTLELPSPMPVGTHIAVVAEDGVQFDATVAWVHEQVAGADRPPGMIVVPELSAEPAAAWWKARVELPDEEAPRPRPRTRPVTVRPRSQSGPPPVPTARPGAPGSIKADLEARVTAAAGLAPPPPAVIEPPAVADEDAPEVTLSMTVSAVDDAGPTTIMPSVDPEALGLELPGEVTDPGHPAHASGSDPGSAGADGDDDGGPTDPGAGR